MLVAFIDERGGRVGGVEPICRVLTAHECHDRPVHMNAHKRRATSAARTVRDSDRESRPQHRIRFW